jgi:hypothetical protein
MLALLIPKLINLATIASFLSGVQPASQPPPTAPDAEVILAPLLAIPLGLALAFLGEEAGARDFLLGDGEGEPSMLGLESGR